MNFKNLIKHYLKKYILYNFSWGGQVSYSQFGEDIWFNKLFISKAIEGSIKRTNGFYIDIGCHHPVNGSQTYQFYKNGWRGIVIDPLPESIFKYTSIRKRDIYCNYGIGNSNTTLNYYMYDNSVLNSFNYEFSSKIANNFDSKLIQKKEISVIKLSNLLDKYLPKDVSEIDFMSVDVEGNGLEVLKSNDWNKYRPKYLTVESDDFNPKNLEKSKLCEFLDSQNYIIIGIVAENLIFEDFSNKNFHHYNYPY